jgi:hypothetical protein
MFPRVVRCNSFGERDGLSEVEFNKLLQASGFRRVRNRKAGVSNRVDDPLGAGLYMFSGIRWLNPDESQEVEQLSVDLARLILKFPHLESLAAGGIDWLLAILRRNRQWWEESAWRQSRRRRQRQHLFIHAKLNASETSGTASDANHVAHTPCLYDGGVARSIDAPTAAFCIAGKPKWTFADQCRLPPPPLPYLLPAASPFTLTAKLEVEQTAASPFTLTAKLEVEQTDPAPFHSLPSLPEPSAAATRTNVAVEPEADLDAQRPAWKWAWEDGELWPAARADWLDPVCQHASAARVPSYAMAVDAACAALRAPSPPAAAPSPRAGAWGMDLDHALGLTAAGGEDVAEAWAGLDMLAPALLNA